MKYQLHFTIKAEKQLKKLDRCAQEQIALYIKKYFIDSQIDPRSHGKPLTGKFKGSWRYEIGKYRLICDINDNICQVLVIKTGHRRDVYR